MFLPPRPTQNGLRLSFLYGAIFTVIGVQMPFWPVWLEHRGMEPLQIGILLGAIYWAKVVTNPLIGALVDSYGHRHRIMVILAACAVALFSLYLWADGFTAFLVIGVLGGSVFAALMPLSETVAMSLTMRGRLDYGRVRLWGSLTFIGMSLVGGWLLEWASPEAVLWLTLGGVATTLAAVVTAPRVPDRHRDGPRPPFSSLFRDRGFVLFLATASLTQVSHTVYYGFATLHWRDAGLAGGTIGALWAVGVVAEVVLFAASGAVVRWLGPARLLLLGALAGVVRWSAIAVTTDPAILFPVQLLHAATFGCTHLGAMHFIARAVDPRLSARAQAVYSSTAMGLAPGLALIGVGPLYAALGGQAFLAMAAVAAGGVTTGWALRRHRRAQAENGADGNGGAETDS